MCGMKFKSAAALCVLLAGSPLHSAEPAKDNRKSISVDELNNLKIIGKLGIPLGLAVAMEATVVAGEGKSESGRYFLKVTSVAGKILKEPVTMRFRSANPGDPFPADGFELYKQKTGKTTGALSGDVQKSLEKDYVGSEVKFLGLESGFFSGTPEGLPDPGAWQGHNFQFVSELVVAWKV